MSKKIIDQRRNGSTYVRRVVVETTQKEPQKGMITCLTLGVALLLMVGLMVAVTGGSVVAAPPDETRPPYETMAPTWTPEPTVTPGGTPHSQQVPPKWEPVYFVFMPFFVNVEVSNDR